MTPPYRYPIDTLSIQEEAEAEAEADAEGEEKKKHKKKKSSERHFATWETFPPFHCGEASQALERRLCDHWSMRVDR